MKKAESIYDNPPCRRGTDCVKIDSLKERYGSEDLTALWVADMDFPAPEEVVRSLSERVAHPVYGYSVVPDSYWKSVISWIGKHYGFSPEREELSYIPGIVRGIGLAINYYTKPGDRILIMPPVYHPFRILIEGNGRECVVNALLSDPVTGRYGIDFCALERIVSEKKPVMMILCNPHNPSGRQWSLEELRQIAGIAAKYDVKVISDEIHGDLMLPGKEHACYFNAGEDSEKTGMVFGAPSKTFNIPGLVSSWIAIRNPELRNGFYSWLETNEFNAPAFFATIATEAAYNYGEPWLRTTMDYIVGNMKLLGERLSVIPGIKMVEPDASYLVWLDCRGLGLSQEQLNKLFTEDARLALNDGAMFGVQGTGYMRMNVALPRKELECALERLGLAVEKLKNR